MKKKYYCLDCNEKITYNTWHYSSKKCRSCSAKIVMKNRNQLGKNNPNYKHGKTNNNKCIDCNKKIKYKTKRCHTCTSIGKLNNSYKNGNKITTRGYKKILSLNHPYKDAHNYVMEHRLIMETYLGRYLKLEEVVHHINEKLNDNRLINLLLFKNNSLHAKFHFQALNFLSNSQKKKNLLSYIKWFQKQNKTIILGIILKEEK